MPDFYRRRLVMAMALSPLLPALKASAASAIDATRIISLEWLPTELLMALGVAPMGAAEMDNYQLWVGEPRLPATTVDVGLRTEPNLELMAEMRPSLILYSSGYGPGKEKFEKIAPAMGFSFNDASGRPLTLARQSLMQLAERIQRVPQGQAHLAAFDAFIAEARGRIAARAPRRVLLMSLLDARHAMVFGKNSLFLDVMNELGLENAWQGETSFWGSAVIGLERLAAIKDVDAICFAHGDDNLMEQVSKMPLWQSFDFVRQKRFRRVPQVWFYGGTPSAMRFCRLLDEALGTL